MNRRDLPSTRAWMLQGTSQLLAVVEALNDETLDSPSLLPGWSRRMVVAHVASNADALANLVAWAATGVETPMYASPEQRLSAIRQGTELATPDLVRWLRTSADSLASGLDQLHHKGWSWEVQTAQGRTVPATELPWMRDRELWVHMVDLDIGRDFDHAPDALLVALVDDIVAKRSLTAGNPALELKAEDSGESWSIEGEGEPAAVSGSLPQLTAFLAGRPSMIDGPDLPPWL